LYRRLCIQLYKNPIKSIVVRIHRGSHSYNKATLDLCTQRINEIVKITKRTSLGKVCSDMIKDAVIKIKLPFCIVLITCSFIHVPDYKLV